MSELVSLMAAAEMLGVSRRRVQALVDDNQLSGDMIGASRVVAVEDVRHLERVRRQVAGKPLAPERAWQVINHLDPRDIELLDLERRRVRTRAEHQPWYVHPAVRKRLRETFDRRRVLSGSDAAAAHDVPVGGPDDLMHVYIRASDQAWLREETQPELRTVSTGNMMVHVVGDPDWPFHGERFAGLNIAWLDMADHGERGAQMVLDEWRRSR
jgi:hypothetical protein